MPQFSTLARCLWAMNFAQSAPLRLPHARVPDASSMATCCGTAAMSLSAAPAEAPIFLPLAPTRPVRALMLAHGMLLILILPPGASGAFPYDSAPLLCARARGDFRELRSTDPSAEHAPLELFLGPSDPVLTDGPP